MSSQPNDLICEANSATDDEMNRTRTLFVTTAIRKEAPLMTLAKRLR